MKFPIRLRFPFGTLKIATYLQLSSAEHGQQLPMRQLGRYYLIWKSGRAVEPGARGARRTH